LAPHSTLIKAYKQTDAELKCFVYYMQISSVLKF